MENVLKTGTTTVGIVCKDCVVLAADKRATAGHFIANKKVAKVQKVNDRMALTMAGTVSDIQLLIKYIRAELKLKEIKTARTTTVKEAANLLAGMVYSNIRKMSMIPGVSHFIFAGYDKNVHLYDVFADGSISEIDDFVSSGSGSVMAYGLLETSYKKDMSEEQGVDLAIKCINAAIQRDSASGGGVDVVAINKDGIKDVAHKLLTQKLE